MDSSFQAVQKPASPKRRKSPKNLRLDNTELDSFAYIASHDLKEPLRGIHNYSNFLMEDYAEVLDADGVSKLNAVVRLTQRMEDLINSLHALFSTGTRRTLSPTHQPQ